MNRPANGAIVILIITFIIGQFFPHPIFTGVYATLTVVVVIVSLFYSKGLSRVFGSLMVLVGCTVFLVQHQPLAIWGPRLRKTCRSSA